MAERPERIAIVDALRTPFAKAGGVLRGFQADDLGAIAVRELMARVPVESTEIDELVMGNVAQPAHAANIARVIALKAGLPEGCPAYTVHRNCASGMEALSTAALKIRAGQAKVIVCGGTEAMSHIPLMFGPKMVGLFEKLMRAKSPLAKLQALSTFRPSFLAPVIAVKLGLTDPVCGLNMGDTAEVLAKEFGISRKAQDEYALMSHQRACAATESGALGEEIMPLPLAPAYATVMEHDDGPRKEQSLAALAKLKPYFDRKTGSVTVGNACPITDGAAAMLVMSESDAKHRGLTPLGYLSDFTYAGLDPRRMGLGPVFATAKLCRDTGQKLSDFDLVELNEAFAAQVIANEIAFGSDTFAQKELNLPSALGSLTRDKLNINGGAIALGHPVGTTGARLILTLLKSLHREGKSRGLATLCIGGGQGAAFAVEVA